MEFDLLFIGGFFPKNIEDEIFKNSKSNIQVAANNLQWEILNGLYLNNASLSIINSLFIGSYPKNYKKLLIPTFIFNPFNKISIDRLIINSGFFNLVGFKHFSKYVNIKKHLKIWLKSNDKRNKVVLVYSLNATFTRILRFAKKVKPSIITCIIVPDLPDFMNLSTHKSYLYKILKSFEKLLIKNDKDYIDSYILLTEHMKEKIENNKPSIVMEGISTDLFSNIKVEKQDFKSILYAGSLNYKYGVIDLIKAFIRIDNPHFRLILCGLGDAETDIIKFSKADSRILYLGSLKRENLLILQKSSYILINPRNSNFSFTRYSFPSKILEYMSSGRPVMSYALSGIPNEYFNYLYEISNENDGLYKSLISILSKPEEELFNRGQKTQEFVLKEKSNIVQTKRIMDFFTSIFTKRKMDSKL
jgi:glycosyltransferase involved in cell wall biosynthesis